MELLIKKSHKNDNKSLTFEDSTTELVVQYSRIGKDYLLQQWQVCCADTLKELSARVTLSTTVSHMYTFALSSPVHLGHHLSVSPTEIHTQILHAAIKCLDKLCEDRGLS